MLASGCSDWDVLSCLTKASRACDLEMESVVAIAAQNGEEIHQFAQEAHGPVDYMSGARTENAFGKSQTNRMVVTTALRALAILV